MHRLLFIQAAVNQKQNARRFLKKKMISDQIGNWI